MEVVVFGNVTCPLQKCQLLPMTILGITTILALELETEDTEAGSMLFVAELLRNKLLISMVAFVIPILGLQRNT